MQQNDSDGITELLLGGTGTAIAGKAYSDFSKLKNISTDWEKKLNDVFSKVDNEAFTFRSPVTGANNVISPDLMDEVHSVYHDGAQKILRKRILGIQAGHLYRGSLNAATKTNALWDWLAKKTKKSGVKAKDQSKLHKKFSLLREITKPIPGFAGVFGSTDGGSHNSFYQNKTRAEALAHHTREWNWLNPSIRSQLIEDVLVKGDDVLRLPVEHNKKITVGQKGGTIDNIRRGYSKILNSHATSEAGKAEAMRILDFLNDGAKPTSRLTDLAKKIGVTKENFGFGPIYKGLVSEWQNATGDNKNKLYGLIKEFEDNALHYDFNNTFAADIKKNSTGYKNLGKLVGKWGKRLSGLGGLAGLGLTGYGAYKQFNKD